MHRMMKLNLFYFIYLFFKIFIVIQVQLYAFSPTQFILKPSVMAEKTNSNLSTCLNSLVQSFQWFIFILELFTRTLNISMVIFFFPSPLIVA